MFLLFFSAFPFASIFLFYFFQAQNIIKTAEFINAKTEKHN